MVGNKIGKHPPREDVPWWLIAAVMSAALFTLVMVYT
jgi:hypothetical protein